MTHCSGLIITQTKRGRHSVPKGEEKIPVARRAALGICWMTLLAIVAFAPARATARTQEANAPCTKVTLQNIFFDITSWTDVNTYPAGTAAKSLPNLIGLAPGTGTINVDICRVAFTIDNDIDVEVWLPSLAGTKNFRASAMAAWQARFPIPAVPLAGTW